jgi:hypothetical protein
MKTCICIIFITENINYTNSSILQFPVKDYIRVLVHSTNAEHERA